MRHLALILVLLACSWGCGANMAPVMDVRGAPLPPAMTASTSAIRDAIVRGMTRKTWSFVGEQGQAILARVEAGGHWAVARIDYNERSYSITYADSSPGLKYNGVEIHRRYNHWVKQLRQAIDAEMSQSTLSAPAPAAPAQAPATTAPAAPPPTAAPAPVAPSEVPAPPPASATPAGG